MKVDGVAYRTIWRRGSLVEVIDQTARPHLFRTVSLTTADQA